MSSTSRSTKRHARAAADSDPACRGDIDELIDEAVGPDRQIRLTGLVGGCKRRRSGSGMRPMNRPVAIVPEDGALSCGYRFPTEPATKGQEKRLKAIVKEYLRRDIAFRHRDFGADSVAEALGMSVSAAEKLMRSARDEDIIPVVELVKDVFLAMFRGDIAGILGTRKTKTISGVFSLIHYNLSSIEFETATDRDWFRRVSAAFRLDYNEWRYR